MAVPGKGIRIAGQDYCSVEAEGDSSDLDLGPGGLKVINSQGHAGENDQESKIKAGR